jgi:hypothetical protein
VPYDDEHYGCDRFSLAHIDIAAPYQFDDVASLSSRSTVVSSCYGLQWNEQRIANDTQNLA